MAIKIVFFGTPEFVIPTLQELIKNKNVELKYIVSMPDRPAGRGQLLQSPAPVLFAKENNVPYFQTENINKEVDFLKKLKDDSIDLFIVLAFSQFFKINTLSVPSIGCFNIHTSLLPKYRGSSPIQYALLNGETTTGVSIQRMVKKMDAGDICIQRQLAIASDDHAESLSRKLSTECALATNDLIKNICNHSLAFVAQDEKTVSFAKIIKKEDGYLNFKKESTTTIIRKFRAYYPWPGLYCFFDKKRVKINQLSIETQISLPPGEYLFNNSRLFVGCMDGVVRLENIQLEGKKPQQDSLFINGIKSQNWAFKINP